ncbi:hypothetical protein [Duganella sp. S19_KUP01_CR8]|uniref:hypothetical protein n=1 Tax=Duganella sp. S19_KUP01_CR8 TaxID=3025502 RepID=UPI002FCDB4AD
MFGKSLAAQAFGAALLLGFGYAGMVVVLSLLTTVTAQMLGCQVDEGSVHQCMVLGADIGKLLYASGMTVMLMLVAMPLVLIAVGAALSVAVGAWLSDFFGA